MRTVREIRTAIRELKREMKAQGIRVSSCFNGGHSRESMRYNQQLFVLKSELLTAESSSP